MSEANNSEQESRKPTGFAAILALPNDSTKKTIIMAILICLVCAVFVSVAAVALKPTQLANKSLDKKKNILAVAGLYEEGSDIEKAFEQIEVRLVDLTTGSYVEEGVDPVSYDQRKAAKDPKGNVKIPKDQDIASIRTRAKYTPVYLVKDGEDIKMMILPMHGYGLWSTLYGFMALESDANTIAGLGFYEHAETPGLGGEVDNPKWKGLWAGKQVYDDAGKVKINIVKESVTPQTPNHEFKVDALAGATLTSRGVANMLHYWLGENGYKKYLSKFMAERS